MIYVTLARLTVVLYAAMSVAAALSHRPREAAISALFAVSNALIFWRQP